MCGFVGLISNTSVAPGIHLAMQALQHRGQDSAGITTMSPDGGEFFIRRGLGSVPQALDDADQTVRTRVYARLKGNTGQTFPFNPTAPIEQRRAQQEKWQQWWASQQ